MVSCTCDVGALSKRPMDGSDARYMSTDNGPRPVSIASNNVRAREPGRSIGAFGQSWAVIIRKADDPVTYASERVFGASDYWMAACAGHDSDGKWINPPTCRSGAGWC